MVASLCVCVCVCVCVLVLVISTSYSCRQPRVNYERKEFEEIELDRLNYVRSAINWMVCSQFSSVLVQIFVYTISNGRHCNNYTMHVSPVFSSMKVYDVIVPVAIKRWCALLPMWQCCFVFCMCNDTSKGLY